MPIRLKQGLDVLAMLKEHGFSTYRLRKEKIFGEGTLQRFRNGEAPSYDVLATLCQLLNCQPGDLLEYVQEEK